MPKPRWYLALQAAGQAMESAYREKGLAVFSTDEFDQAAQAQGFSKRRMSGVWLPRLVELKVIEPVWSIATTGDVEYTVTFFGREILDL
jgi:hypothetical protein